jgi:hypothetical protein
MIESVTNRRRRIDLSAPLEVFTLSAVCTAFPESYRVRAVIVDSDGELDSVSHDFLGRPLPSSRLRRQLAREAVRVLSLQDQIASARRPQETRKPARRSLIPEVWGLRLRGISHRQVG